MIKFTYQERKRLSLPFEYSERGAKAGIRTIGIGPLFGLSDIRQRGFYGWTSFKIFNR